MTILLRTFTFNVHQGLAMSVISWPELTPLKGEPPLAKSGEKALREYTAVYGNEIEKRIREIYPRK